MSWLDVTYYTFSVKYVDDIPINPLLDLYPFLYTNVSIMIRIRLPITINNSNNCG